MYIRNGAWGIISGFGNVEKNSEEDERASSQNDIVTNKPDLTERICQAIREVKLMREGKIKELSMDELLDEL